MAYPMFTAAVALALVIGTSSQAVEIAASAAIEDDIYTPHDSDEALQAKASLMRRKVERASGVEPTGDDDIHTPHDSGRIYTLMRRVVHRKVEGASVVEPTGDVDVPLTKVETKKAKAVKHVNKHARQSNGEEVHDESEISQKVFEESKAKDPVSPFNNAGEQGCNDLIDKCSPHHGDVTAWHVGNLSAWRVGFGICCVQAGEPGSDCDALEDQLFNIMQPAGPYAGSHVVKDLPNTAAQPVLDDFCRECQDILVTYFDHEHTNQVVGVNGNGGGNLLAGAIQKVHHWRRNARHWKRLLSAGTAQSRSALAKKRLNKCLSDPECSQNIQGAKENLVRASKVFGQNHQDYELKGCYQGISFQAPPTNGTDNSSDNTSSFRVPISEDGVLECRNACYGEGEGTADFHKYFGFSCPSTDSAGNHTVECSCGGSADVSDTDAIPIIRCTQLAQDSNSTSCAGPDFTLDGSNIGDYDFGSGDGVIAVFETEETPEQTNVIGHTYTCFPGNSEVWTEDWGEIPLSVLSAGSRVQSPELKPNMMPTLTEYMTDVHLQEADHADVELEYTAISHELMKSGRPLRISGNHLLYASVQATGPWELKPAHDVKVGDFVLAIPLSKQEDMVTSNAPHVLKASAVTKLSKIRARGVYSPLTMTGRQVVDGVAVSSIAFTTDTQLRAFRFGQSRGVTPEQIEFFIRLALFPNKIWYWAGLPFSWLHSGYSNSRGPTAFWEWFFDTLVFPLVVFMEQQTGCISYILSYIV